MATFWMTIYAPVLQEQDIGQKTTSHSIVVQHLVDRNPSSLIQILLDCSIIPMVIRAEQNRNSKVYSFVLVEPGVLLYTGKY